jgi:hypothetical protein
MDTVFGRATILNQARQTDGIVEVQLIGWTLANGANPTMYTIPSATTFTTTTSATTSSPLNPDYNLTTGSSKSTPPQTAMPALSDQSTPNTVGCKTPKVGGEAVEFYNDDYFAKVRNNFNIPADVVENVNIFNWNKMKPSEGKGGDAMQFTPDRKYIVKELGSDHTALLDITKEYVAHICQSESLLVRFALHFKRISDQKNYVLMNSWLPKPEGASVTLQEDAYFEIYDLKGCADDKMMHRDYKRLDQIHARCWDCKTTYCPEDDRKLYKKSKEIARTKTFFLHSLQRDRVLSKITSDAQFLRMVGLMDYSLIVGKKQCSTAIYKEKVLPCGGFSPGDAHGKDQAQPYLAVHDDTVSAYYVGIIDFLQFYKCGKVCAHHIKCCDLKPLATVHPSVYGKRFEHYFTQKFQVANGTLPTWVHVLDDLEAGDEAKSTDINVGMSKSV